MAQGQENAARMTRNEPPAALVAYWSERLGGPFDNAEWRPLAGGRTNRLWRVTGAQRDLVVKLFRPEAQTPLFCNDPQAEVRALEALQGIGIAPEFLANGVTEVGPSLVYAHVAGTCWQPGNEVADVARALARLHATPVPTDFGRAPAQAAHLRQQAREMLAQAGAAARAIAALEPDPRGDTALPGKRFLHGDPTAGNTLVSGRAIAFIDWQCPVCGDPVLDLAVFLSPAMQVISGNPPLSRAEEDTFLDAYGDVAIARRYRALAPLLHWRMAAYCLWRAARGESGYAEAAAREVARLRAAR
ncbi:phosphotransferase family protein [Maritimibacter sp. HL-12]|uniref:phosphotransferase family protein n=1 Tax=Maritimibacter sp. HL-12 TaxID=1162418 RepID=UPI000A0F0719|nr:aminoglycoside phosphotransferase family protein [Maritimibacter sp. HL-12]SMH42577.1 Predicted kinase, aminoglycoside phosphotransferase (APT) family [Maritimibacter sp. HL-12]